MHYLTRRRFLRASLGAVATLAIGHSGYSWLSHLASSSPAMRSTEPITRTGHALGTTVSLTALADPQWREDRDKDKVTAALDAAFVELDLIENVLSLYRPHSQLCRLNSTGHLEKPHSYLLEVLRASLAMSQRTQGAFDVTVQPLWQVYAMAQKQQQSPDLAALAKAMAAVGCHRIDVRDDRIVMANSDSSAAAMAITFNGIAQGFALDRVKAVLQAHGITSALLDVGELASLGHRQDGQPWKAGIQHPRQADAYAAIAELDQRSLATSGDYATSFAADHTSHHLIDPRTGLSPDELASVSIAAPTAMEADALSTAVFILGFERGMALIQSSDNVDALFILKDGRQRVTPGFPQVQA